MTLPQSFVYLRDICPTIQECPYYATAQNFIQRPVPGYTHGNIVCTDVAAQRLKLALEFFADNGFDAVVYDGYRPQSAVDAFIAWGQDTQDERSQAAYHPTFAKQDLFNLGYLSAERSTHSRGSTFDLTLIPKGRKVQAITPTLRHLPNGETILWLDDGTVDMGSGFDLFHPISHHGTDLLEQRPQQLRDCLKTGMLRAGFLPYEMEWWHYTLEQEPFPDTYHTFSI